MNKSFCHFKNTLINLTQFVVFMIVISTCIIMSFVPSARATISISCDELTKQERNLDTFPKMLIQVGLFHVDQEFSNYFSNKSIDSKNLQDGILGKQTLRAIELFCDELPETQKQNVIDSLFMYAAIRAVEPQCEAVSSVSLLTSWLSLSKEESVRTWSQTLLSQCDQSKLIKFSDNNIYFKTSKSDLLSALGDDNDAAKELISKDTLTPINQTFVTKQTFTKSMAAYLSSIEDKEKSRQNRGTQLEQLAEESKHTFSLPKYVVPAADCDCVQDFSYDDTLYHFYPAFMGSDTPPEDFIDKTIKITQQATGAQSETEENPDPGAQGDEEKNELSDEQANAIDYSVVSRIGFQGIAIDASGSIADIIDLKDSDQDVYNRVRMSRTQVEELWRQQRESFITQAHRFYSKADLVLELQDYIAWDKRTIDSALATIDNRLLEDIDAYESYSRYSADKGLDGITLFFRDFKQNTLHTKRVTDIVKSFLSFKKEHYPNLKINIFLDIPDMCNKRLGCFTAKENTIEQFFNLCEIIVGSPQSMQDGKQRCIKQDNSSDMTVDSILVLLPAPSFYSGLFLRRLIEERFVREASAIALNKIIPVVSPYPIAKSPDDTKKILDANLFFNKQNFNGTGFWPMPMTGDALFNTFQDSINNIMVEGFTDSEITGEFQTSKAKSYIQDAVGETACKFICTQRQYVRIVFDIFAGIMLLTLVFKNASCKLCKIIDGHSFIYRALWVPIILLFIAMLGCDRFLEDKPILVITFLVLLGLFLLFGKPLLERKKRQDLADVQVIEDNKPDS